MTEVLETAKQSLTALATRLRRYTREAEAKIINGLCSIHAHRVHSQLQVNSNKSSDVPIAKND